MPLGHDHTARPLPPLRQLTHERCQHRRHKPRRLSNSRPSVFPLERLPPSALRFKPPPPKPQNRITPIIHRLLFPAQLSRTRASDVSTTLTTLPPQLPQRPVSTRSPFVSWPLNSNISTVVRHFGQKTILEFPLLRLARHRSPQHSRLQCEPLFLHTRKRTHHQLPRRAPCLELQLPPISTAFARKTCPPVLLARPCSPHHRMLLKKIPHQAGGIDI